LWLLQAGTTNVPGPCQSVYMQAFDFKARYCDWLEANNIPYQYDLEEQIFFFSYGPPPPRSIEILQHLEEEQFISLCVLAEHLQDGVLYEVQQFINDCNCNLLRGFGSLAVDVQRGTVLWVMTQVVNAEVGPKEFECYMTVVVDGINKVLPYINVLVRGEATYEEAKQMMEEKHREQLQG